MKATYRVFVEGQLHDENLTLKKAESLRVKFEAEGWNVKVLKIVQTLLGAFGVSV